MRSYERFTDEQRKAILSRRKSLLVSAAAGSGKTAVLVERIISLITSGGKSEKAMEMAEATAQEPVNIDRLLVATFTNAAASEMKQRIAGALSELAEQYPENENLKRQQLLIGKASIMTIHAFCLNTIRKYFYKVDIDPLFRTIDETEANIIKSALCSELFEEMYEKEENIEDDKEENIEDDREEDRDYNDFITLVDAFSESDLKDIKVQNIVLELYKFIQGIPFYNDFLDSTANELEFLSFEEITETDWYLFLLNDLLETLKDCLTYLDSGIDLLKRADCYAGYTELIYDDMEKIKDSISLVEKGYKYLQQTAEIKFNTWPSSNKKEVKNCSEYAKELHSEVHALRNEVKDIVKNAFTELLYKEPEFLLADQNICKSYIKTLCKILSEFDKRYKEYKKNKNLLDFGDYEHKCLAILLDRDENSNSYKPSEEANTLMKQYHELLIDEFQDSNEVQEAIMNAISRERIGLHNRFVVGDIKQSIYRFRQANPYIFQKKYMDYAQDLTGNCEKIDLSKNFRSRHNVIDFINFVCEKLFTKKTGDLEYDESARLYCGAEYPVLPDVSQATTEVFMLEGKKIEAEEDADDRQEAIIELTKAEIEAKFIAVKISEILQKPYMVTGKNGTLRNIELNDIVILMRSPKRVSEAYVRELNKINVPSFTENASGYFAASEIITIINILKIVDNPRQDINLISVMYSDIYGFSAEDLVEIKLHSQSKKVFFDSLCEFRKTGNNILLLEKATKFMNDLYSWQKIAINMSISDLVWRIYNDTDFLEIAGLMPGGKIRRANLIALFERAVGFNETGRKSLFNFIRYIEKLQERDADFGTAKVVEEKGGHVRIMSMHKSKGLEFPVVFLAGLTKQINIEDSKRIIQMNKEYGFASYSYDMKMKIKSNNLHRAAIMKRNHYENISEEIRVLYVALTRAREKLFLVGAVNDTEKYIKRILTKGIIGKKIRQQFIRSKKVSMMDWLVSALYCDESNPCFRFEIINDINDIGEAQAITVEQVTSEQVTDIEIFDEISKMLFYTYQNRLLTQIPTKISVTEIKRMRNEEELSIFDEATNRNSFEAVRFRGLKSSKENKKPPQARIGTMIHAIMERLDFRKRYGLEDIDEIINGLISSGKITEQESRYIDKNLPLSFANTSIYAELSRSKEIFKEIPFVIGVEPSFVTEKWKGVDKSRILVHGIIDCFYEVDDGFVLLDYKSDKINNNDYSAALKKYKIQLEVYKKAIEYSYKRPVIKTMIYFFDTDSFVEI